MSKPTRFVVLPDERGLLLGIDGMGVFMPGMVYECKVILGEVVIRAVGATSATLPGPGHVSTDPNQIIAAGRHLVAHTELKGGQDD